MSTTFEDRDEFGRISTAIKIANLIKSDIDVSPILVDGGWGTGKTEFCVKFVSFLKSSHPNLTPVYINAFEYDHTDDPFTVLIAKVASVAPVENTAKERFINSAVPVAKVFAKAIGRSAISWALKAEADSVVTEIKEAVETGANEILDIGIKDTFERFEKLDDNLKILRQAIKDVASDKQIVVIVDELDRCKPSFALEFLEKVKHVFNVENINFVFATNLKQMQAIVKNTYGSTINSQEYLDKFFNLKINFSNRRSVTSHEVYLTNNGLLVFEQEMLKHEDMTEVFEEGLLSRRLIAELFEMRNISLREAKTFSRHLCIQNALDSNSIGKSASHHTQLSTIFGTYLYLFEPELADSLLSDYIERPNLESIFGFSISALSSSGAPIKDPLQMMLAILFVDAKSLIVESVEIAEKKVQPSHPAYTEVVINNLLKATYSNNDLGAARRANKIKEAIMNLSAI
ncbi:P-loop NTPase fold protein [Halobacteriovorax sp. RZ-1]|uniref:KAP family P-loop NTPase fold protein n=1 Tax=unclassified Halobacteriovorax TaxID=2639665 RepID=UPI0037113E4F